MAEMTRPMLWPVIIEAVSAICERQARNAVVAGLARLEAAVVDSEWCR